jgi:hypothetical protein
MKQMIVQSLEMLSSALFVLVIVIGFLGGAMSGGFMGAIVGLIVAAVWAVIAFGIIFLLLEMNENLRAIRGQLDRLPR